ncbi:MAG: hypothetical protein Q9181_001888 [Wetmoreana brouardii]
MTALVLSFTTHESLLRPGGLLLMIYSARVQGPYIKYLEYPIYRGFLGNAPFVLVILYIDKVLLHKWEYAVKGPTSSAGGLSLVRYKATEDGGRDGKGIVDDTIARIWFGLSISLQSRFPATKWPIKNIPPFSKEDPAYIPSKAGFLGTTISKWIIYVLLLDLAGLFSDGSDNAISFSPGRIPFFSRLTIASREEVITRVLSIGAFWIVQYFVIEVVYCALAIVAVASGISAVETWPPMFGSFSDAYSLRQFWGKRLLIHI